MSERDSSLRSPRAVSSGHIREEVYNVKLAELLAERGATNCEAERRHGDDMPDVIFEWFGLGAVLEAKYADAGADSKPESTCALRRAPSPVGEGPTGAKAKQPRSKWPASGETPALKRHVQVSKGGSDRSGRSMKRRLPHRKALDGSGEPRWIW